MAPAGGVAVAVGLTVGVSVASGVTVSVASGVAVSVGSSVGDSVAVGVGVGSSCLDELPPKTLVERPLPLTEWPKIASSDAVTTAAPITAATRPVMMPSFQGKPRRLRWRSGVRSPNGSSSSPHRPTRSGSALRAPTAAGFLVRTTVPSAVRRVTTRGAALVMTLVGRFRASVTRATMIGVTAVAISEPRSQK